MASSLQLQQSMNVRGFMNSEYVCVGTTEETVLENYFVMLSKFNFERAKEQSERERDSKTGVGGVNWCDFMNLLARLATAESSYYSLHFVGRTWLVKKEQLKTTYEIILQEFKKVHEIYYHRKGGTDFNWEKKMTELLTSIMEYVIARKEMITFYQSLDTPDGCHSNYFHSNQLLKEIQDHHSERFQHHFLKPVRLSYWSEVNVLIELMKAQEEIGKWQFLPAMLALQSSHTKLTSWCGIQPPGLPVSDSTSRLPSIRPRSVTLTSSLPALYQWLCTLHNTLLAKFTLYFYKILQDNSVLNDAKITANKFEKNFVQIFSDLTKHSLTSCVCLIFDTNGLEGFKGPEYRLPGSPAPTLIGLNSYPIMMSMPQDFDFLPHKANIVSMIMSQGANSPSTGITTQHDCKLHSSYRLAQIDPRVTLVAILVSGKSKDQDILTSTLVDVINRLRLQYIFHLLSQ